MGRIVMALGFLLIWGVLNPSLSADTVDVVDLGADPTGTLDSAPSVRKAIESHRTVVFRPGTYRFASTVDVEHKLLNGRENPDYVCCARQQTAVLIKDKQGLRIVGEGATIIVDPAIARSSVMFLSNDRDIEVQGLTFIGSKEGVPAFYENAVFALDSIVNLRIHNIVVKDGFGGFGAVFAADWIINSKIYDNIFEGIGVCWDGAFVKNLELFRNRARGGGLGSNSGGGGVGRTCYSNIFDSPNADTNKTEFTFSDTDGVSIHDNVIENFELGANIISGLNYTFLHNRWLRNIGRCDDSVKHEGFGIRIAYNAKGLFASTGHPPGDIRVDGDEFIANGVAHGGGGIVVVDREIMNQDAIRNVVIQKSRFIDNGSFGISLRGGLHTRELRLYSNVSSGSPLTSIAGH